MLKDYIFGPVIEPYLYCDARFARKYGITEAFIFNFIYHDFMTSSQRIRYGGWHKEDGLMESDGHIWRCHSENVLYKWFSSIFDEQQHKDAIEHLCNEGLLYMRPSLTAGYCWITIGEEQDGDGQTN